MLPTCRLLHPAATSSRNIYVPSRLGFICKGKVNIIIHLRMTNYVVTSFHVPSISTQPSPIERQLYYPIPNPVSQEPNLLRRYNLISICASHISRLHIPLGRTASCTSITNAVPLAVGGVEVHVNIAVLLSRLVHRGLDAAIDSVVGAIHVTHGVAEGSVGG